MSSTDLAQLRRDTERYIRGGNVALPTAKPKIVSIASMAAKFKEQRKQQSSNQSQAPSQSRPTQTASSTPAATGLPASSRQAFAGHGHGHSPSKHRTAASRLTDSLPPQRPAFSLVGQDQTASDADAARNKSAHRPNSHRDDDNDNDNDNDEDDLPEVNFSAPVAVAAIAKQQPEKESASLDDSFSHDDLEHPDVRLHLMRPAHSTNYDIDVLRTYARKSAVASSETFFDANGLLRHRPLSSHTPSMAMEPSTDSHNVEAALNLSSLGSFGDVSTSNQLMENTPMQLSAVPVEPMHQADKPSELLAMCSGFFEDGGAAPPAAFGLPFALAAGLPRPAKVQQPEAPRPESDNVATLKLDASFQIDSVPTLPIEAAIASDDNAQDAASALPLANKPVVAAATNTIKKPPAADSVLAKLFAANKRPAPAPKPASADAAPTASDPPAIAVPKRKADESEADSTSRKSTKLESAVESKRASQKPRRRAPIFSDDEDEEAEVNVGAASEEEEEEEGGDDDADDESEGDDEEAEEDDDDEEEEVEVDDEDDEDAKQLRLARSKDVEEDEEAILAYARDDSDGEEVDDVDAARQRLRRRMLLDQASDDDEDMDDAQMLAQRRKDMELDELEEAEEYDEELIAEAAEGLIDNGVVDHTNDRLAARLLREKMRLDEQKDLDKLVDKLITKEHLESDGKDWKELGRAPPVDRDYDNENEMEDNGGFVGDGSTMGSAEMGEKLLSTINRYACNRNSRARRLVREDSVADMFSPSSLVMEALARSEREAASLSAHADADEQPMDTQAMRDQLERRNFLRSAESKAQSILDGQDSQDILTMINNTSRSVSRQVSGGSVGSSPSLSGTAATSFSNMIPQASFKRSMSFSSVATNKPLTALGTGSNSFKSTSTVTGGTGFAWSATIAASLSHKGSFLHMDQETLTKIDAQPKSKSKAVGASSASAGSGRKFVFAAVSDSASNDGLSNQASLSNQATLSNMNASNHAFAIPAKVPAKTPPLSAGISTAASNSPFMTPPAISRRNSRHGLFEALGRTK
ncbi:hypothetical protein CAOG_03407 [Capsaspora owczarzaki ATCC 30864]|uniref:Uncharacterized protein n=1 Tax=Capsaspora owczarzaki (strain ATCC 30864) TaxID=595528 RepID=A0A0D2UBL9_CAPO3|nr:hypothetical protein CAOG_03407 [Capsaspora owczarzaki ATCC 30864]KJE92431.1 hypothetical protein CAOG_003407 [Capsaspora owczarzaki ATCC 30864]|eukprot:XP_004364246.1 hypothetical protein CAOG_03407 [Capsaspora owczarzaki ATCC 30864]